MAGIYDEFAKEHEKKLEERRQILRDVGQGITSTVSAVGQRLWENRPQLVESPYSRDTAIPTPNTPLPPTSPELFKANQAIAASQNLNKQWYAKSSTNPVDKDYSQIMDIATPMLKGVTPPPVPSGNRTYNDYDLQRFQSMPGTETALPTFAGGNGIIPAMPDWGKVASNPDLRDAVLASIKESKGVGQGAIPTLPPGMSDMQDKLTQRLDAVNERLRGKLKKSTRAALTNEASSLMSALGSIYGTASHAGIEGAKLPFEAQRIGLEGRRVGLEGKRVGLEAMGKEIDWMKEAREQGMIPYEKMKSMAISDLYNREAMGKPLSFQDEMEKRRWLGQPYEVKERKIYPELYRTISDNLSLSRPKGSPPPTQEEIDAAYQATIDRFEGRNKGGIPPEAGAIWGKDPSGKWGWYKKDPSNPNKWILIVGE